MADVQAPTAEQLADVKAQQDAALAKWEGDFPEDDLKIPYKREEADKTAEEKEETEEKPEDEEAEPGEVEQFSDPDPVVTINNPGNYAPADYSFEVTLADGKTVKVTSPEEAERLADNPDNFETPKQLMEFLSKTSKMERNLDRDYDKWKSQKDEYDSQVETETERQGNIVNLANEFKYLEDKGLVPTVAAEYRNADWQDPEIAKQPGVKEQLALLDYMVKENRARAKAGVSLLTSMIDTFNAFQADPTNKQASDGKKKQAEEQRAVGVARKAASARVAGSSPAQQGAYVPKGIAVGNPNILKRGAAQWDD